MILTVIGTAAAVVAAVCAGACLWLLWPKKGREAPAADSGEGENESEDAALREGILNLLRYTPAANEGKEE